MNAKPMQTVVIHIKHRPPWIPVVLWTWCWRWLPGVWTENELRVPVVTVQDVVERLARR